MISMWDNKTAEEIQSAVQALKNEAVRPRIPVSDAEHFAAMRERYTVPAATRQEMQISASPRDTIGRKITQWLESMQPPGPLVRYCPECGCIGEVDYTKHRDCCPDGSHARYVHPKIAEQARCGTGGYVRQLSERAK